MQNGNPVCRMPSATASQDLEELERQDRAADSIFMERRRARALFDSIPSLPKAPTPVNLIHAPRVLKHYRSVRRPIQKALSGPGTVNTGVA